MPQTSVAKRANFAGAAIILRVLSMMQRMFASAMRSDRLPSCGVPKWVSMLWLSMSNAPESACFMGADSV